MNSSPKYKPKLIVVLSRFPYPLEKGDKLRAFYQLKSLQEKFEITLICTSEEEISNQQKLKLSEFCKQIHVFRLKKWLIYFNLFFNIFSKKPFQVKYFYQNWIQKKINVILELNKPKYIYCQLVRSTDYVKNYHHCPKILDLMDALSTGMERRAAASSFFFAKIFKEESQRLKFYERQILNYFEKSIIISEQDKKLILYPKDKEIITIPNGVSEDFLSADNLDVEKEFDLVFVGNLSYAPNIETCIFIDQKVLPLLKIQFPEIKILFSGASPTSKVLNLKSNNISVKSWVDDIRTSYLSAKIFFAPMLSGTGMQNKILEAMALGIPVVTSSLANNAILAKKDLEILIADTEKDFAAALLSLLNDSDKIKIIGDKGQEFVRENYSWDKSNEKLLQLFEN